MRIRALQTGRVKVKRAQIIGQGHGLRRRLGPLIDNIWSDWLPSYAFAVEHPDGVIMVDTGSSASLMHLPRWHPYFRFAVGFDIDREQEIGMQLARIGITARDVKTVVLTHMHIDHDAGLKDFPSSEVLVAPGELKIASGFAGQIRGYLPQRWPSGFDPKPLSFDAVPFGPFAHSRRLTRDGAVVAIPTPGHTANHISVAVEDEIAPLIMAGDANSPGAARWRGQDCARARHCQPDDTLRISRPARRRGCRFRCPRLRCRASLCGGGSRGAPCRAWCISKRSKASCGASAR